MSKPMQLFGTDGIRGQVGKYPLTEEAVFAIGRTLGLWLKEQYPQKGAALKIIVGKDTRESGLELETALSKGAEREGVTVLHLGTCPTPTVAYLTCALGAHLGVAISASHNPCTDNGIKFFNADGYKLFPFAESRLEEIFSALSSAKTSFALSSADWREEKEAIPLYLNFVKKILNGFNLSSFSVVIDCAFGSFSKIAPLVFADLGARVHALNNEPDGKNINANCGTLHPQMMAQKMLEHKADIGIAFDGDGDRVIVADENGNVLDGDHILAILCQYLLRQKKLGADTIVCTEMSNLGLEVFLEQLGVQMIRTAVGDKFVLQKMLEHNTKLGGEQSGHIILLEHTTTGDGLVVALELIKVMLKTKKPLSELAKSFRKYPQVLVNVKVKEKLPFERIPELTETIKRCQEVLGRSGRLFVRYSGTENLARVMVEGEQSSQVNRIANSVAKVIQEAVGEVRCKH